MIGCDKFCTYCIVPSVRGPEQSRPAAQIVAEARQLAAEGCREITLLGQTVNSYRHTADGRTTRLSDLLGMLHEIDGLARHEVRDELSQGHDRRPARGGARLAQGVALFARAGAKRLEPGAAADEAGIHGGRVSRDAWRAFAQTVPEAAVTSDFIVGFCGETDEDFGQTVELVRECAVQEQLYLQVLRTPRHQERDSCIPTTFPRT